MEDLKIVYYPSPILRNKSKNIETFNDKLQEFIDKMIDAMYKYDGIGLAAPQVGENIRLFVMDPNEGEPFVYINPEIIWMSEEKVKYEEGCLSLPGIYAKVERPAEIKIKALSREGEVIEQHLKELAARVFQHEYDHLNGILFIDRISQLDKFLIKSKLKKLEKEYNKQNR